MSTNQQLIEYIKQARATGKSDAEIKSALLDAGWREADIEKGFVSHSYGLFVDRKRRRKLIVAIIAILILAVLLYPFFVLLYYYSNKPFVMKHPINSYYCEVSYLFSDDCSLAGHFCQAITEPSCDPDPKIAPYIGICPIDIVGCFAVE